MWQRSLPWHDHSPEFDCDGCWAYYAYGLLYLLLVVGGGVGSWFLLGHLLG